MITFVMFAMTFFVQGLTEVKRPRSASIVSYDRVELGYDSSDPCRFTPSPVHLCDTVHVRAYQDALSNKIPNFASKYILTFIKEREEYDQYTVVAVDSTTGVVYPVPIDFFSPHLEHEERHSPPHLPEFSADGNELCLTGSLVAFRAERSGTACFTFDGDRFGGFGTPYSSPKGWTL